MNTWTLWIMAGLLALVSLGQTLWLAMETHRSVAIHGLPADLCREVAAGGPTSVAEAARVYTACRDEAGVKSPALCAQVVKGCLSIQEAARLYNAFPTLSEWEWKQLCPLSAGHMLKPHCQDWDWKMLLSGRVSIGMTDTQVMVAWGIPARVTQIKTAREVWEQWLYEGGKIAGTRTLFFRNGVLTAVHTRRG